MTKSGDPFSRAGILLAPMATVPAAALHLGIWHWDMESAAGALYASLIILPLSYSLTVLVGLPYLFGLCRLGMLNAASISAGGMALGLIVGFVIGIALFPLWDWYARFFYLTLGGICGLAVGLAYWVIHLLTKRP